MCNLPFATADRMDHNKNIYYDIDFDSVMYLLLTCPTVNLMALLKM